MTYTATISSKGQVTVPVKLRKKLMLNGKVIFEEDGDAVRIKRQPSIADIHRALNAPSSGPGLTDSEKNNPMVIAINEKFKRKRERERDR